MWVRIVAPGAHWPNSYRRKDDHHVRGAGLRGRRRSIVILCVVPPPLMLLFEKRRCSIFIGTWVFYNRLAPQPTFFWLQPTLHSIHTVIFCPESLVQVGRATHTATHTHTPPPRGS
eukprot:SAG11_NODE_431_length_9526_cov_11.297019_5_plen_116_part_00